MAPSWPVPVAATSTSPRSSASAPHDLMAWSDQPYKGKPPERDIKGFPRPLYPPDAKQYGKTPSTRGPDVIAYKRTVSRLGRWPWQQFDDGYWTDFAHGTQGPDISNSGVAGVQYQQHIDATGWLGKTTFNTLCYALVPDAPGFMHAGEHAMAYVAVNLINEAYDMFQGHEPAPPDTTLRVKALDRATGELGYTENPAGSNQNKYGAWYGMNGQPWCAMFTTWAFENAGNSPTFAKGSRYAYVPYVVGDAYNGKNGLKVTGDPIPGDLVCYDWSYDQVWDHIGLFETWNGNSFYAIEGNTSTSNNSNGGEVMRRTRNPASQGTVFVRVQEP